ncbi:hypothetical protein Q5W_12775 [Hydrogenophaga sp. PBC]|uniref:major capsid protein n=1 Tax=Hydrogenophaga sp. PBC TaxID=795665 RepID=UPI0002608C92|nr:major capsid protein [Hydrogenophaga sp. PBC]AOS79775.1 hypothetical protein Q5W_12775 [Hydrogenophaga sp. PBC]
MVRFVRKYGAAGAALVLASQAHAALPTEVTTAITAAGTDLLAAVTAVIVAFVAFWGMRKLASKMGWS